MIDQQAHPDRPSPDSLPGHTQLPPPGIRTFFKQSKRQLIRNYCWSLTSKTLFKWSLPNAFRYRARLLRLFKANVHPSVRIDRTVRITQPENLTIGRDVFICPRTILNCIGSITIGERSFIDRECHLCAASHDYHRRDMQLLQTPITIGHHVKLAPDVFVGPNISIGDNTTVGPRSSVVKNLPANIRAQGEPAVEILDS